MTTDNYKGYSIKWLFIRFGFILLAGFFTNGVNGQGFVDITELDGMTITHDGEDPSLISKGFATGAAWIDINNDGYLDLYITMRTGANLLFKNLGPDTNGDITWDEIALSAGAQDASNDGSGVVVGDFNNDGYDDLYLANVSEDVLFKNNGDETFTDVLPGSGLEATGDSRGNSASWGDYDNDGYLDLFVSHHTPYPGSSNATHHDFMFHNNGNGTFTDVSGLLGASHLVGYGFIAGWLDYDRDGDLDIILINDCEAGSPNNDVTTHTKIFRNDSHLSGSWNSWVFVEESAAIGVDDCRNGMGIAIGDIDRDGWLDFAYTNISDCVLFKNDGDGTFTDIASSAGIDGQDPWYYSWGTTFFDYDLDGWQDLFITLGSLDQTSAMQPRPNELYRNNGDDTFTDMGASLNMNDDAKSRSGIFGDYDNDGDIDVFLMNYGEQCILKMNTNNNGNNWLQVKLTGVTSNSNGVGARLKITDGDGVIQYYEIRSGSNLGGGDDMRAYFGLGAATSITELEITWPSGTVQIETGIAINQILYLSESGPLPVHLIDFSAQPVNEDVLLEWSTASESQNAFFTIQRSIDGSTFENIGRVAGNGNTSEINKYDFLDQEPFKGTNYYRLQQTDYDGSENNSAVRSVHFDSGKTEVKVIPNPVSRGEFKLSYKGAEEEVGYNIFDVFGKLIRSGSIQNKETLSIDVANLANGLYIVQLSGKLVHHSEKMLLNK